jgi:hypothetical protein
LAFLGLAYVADMLTEFLDGGPLSQADLDRRDLEAMDSIEAIRFTDLRGFTVTVHLIDKLRAAMTAAMN